MARVLFLLLVMFSLLCCSIGATDQEAKKLANHQRAELRLTEDILGFQCKHMSSFRSISQMESLIETLKIFLDLQREEKERSAQQQGVTMCLANTFRLVALSPAALCLTQANALLDMADVLAHKSNVCSSEQLEAIESYERKYKRQQVATNSTMTTTTTSPKIIKFFQLYANQVSFLCKKKLLHSLHIVDAYQSLQQDPYVEALSWLSNAQSATCKRIKRLEMEFAVDEGQQVNGQQVLMAKLESEYSGSEIRSCHAARVLSEISSIQELVDAILKDEEQGQQDDQMDQLKQTQQAQNNNNNNNNQQQKSGLFLVVPQNQREIMSDMIDTCARLRPIYDQTVMPLVRLVRLGYDPLFLKFEKTCSEDKLIQRWFSITLVCNSVLSSHLVDVNKYKELEAEVSADKKSFVVIDDDVVSDNKQTGDNNNDLLTKNTTDNINNNNDSILEQIKYPIEDELWVHKYAESKFQRLKNSFIKKVFKLFKVEDIDDHIVFRTRIRDTNRWILRLFIVTVAFVTALKG